MRGQHALDLVEGVLALGDEITVVADIAARAVLVLGPDAGEEDELAVADPFDGHGLGEDAARPGAVGEFPLLVSGWCRLLGRGWQADSDGGCERGNGRIGVRFHAGLPWLDRFSFARQ